MRNLPFGYRMMVWAIVAIGALSFVVWARHMYVSDMYPDFGYFFATAGDIARPLVVARKLLKPKTAAEIIDRSLRYVYYLGERGEIEIVHDGRAASVVAESLDAYIVRLREKAAAAKEQV
jgi:hypothetical protein